jgi:hypothetical protein
MSANIKSTNTGSQTSYIIEGTEAEVMEAIAGIERSYHPVGYGTSFYPIKPQGDGKYVAHGYRYNSCD